MLNNYSDDVKKDFERAIEKYMNKIKGKYICITIGLEGTTNRGVDLETAKQLFIVMDIYANLFFLLLLNEDIPDSVNVPKNCILGVTVSDIKDFSKIRNLALSNAKHRFVSFVPLNENVADDFDSDLINNIDYFILEGSTFGEERNEWEENLISFRSHNGNDICLIYDKSVQKNDYDMDVVASELFGNCRLNWF